VDAAIAVQDGTGPVESPEDRHSAAAVFRFVICNIFGTSSVPSFATIEHITSIQGRITHPQAALTLEWVSRGYRARILRRPAPGRRNCPTGFNGVGRYPYLLAARDSAARPSAYRGSVSTARDGSHQEHGRLALGPGSFLAPAIALAEQGLPMPGATCKIGRSSLT